MTYQWAKIELLGRRVRYGRCSAVDVLGQQWIRIEVPFPEKRTQHLGPKYNRDRLAEQHLVFVSNAYEAEFGTSPAGMTHDEIVDKLATVQTTIEQFASIEEYAPAALYGRQLLTEEQVREALKPWTPRTHFAPGDSVQSASPYRLPPPADEGDDWDESMPAPNQLQQVLDRIENASWSSHATPGERVLLECAAGFDGVGRPDAAKNARRWADGCTTDARALRHLLDFQWNERADLPVAIRDMLGIDRDGNACYCADDIDEYLRQTGNDDPFSGECDTRDGPTSEAQHQNGFLCRGCGQDKCLCPDDNTKATPINAWSYEFYDVDGDKLFIQSPRTHHDEPHVAEIGVVVDASPTIAIWCPTAKQLEALYNRVGDILNADSVKGLQVTASGEPYPEPRFIDIDEHSYVAAHVERDACPRCPWIPAPKLRPLISQDGSAYEADHCVVCGGTWWHAFPVPPEPSMVRQTKPKAAVNVRTDSNDSTRVNVSINGADEVSPSDSDDECDVANAPPPPGTVRVMTRGIVKLANGDIVSVNDDKVVVLDTPKAAGDVVGFKPDGTPKVKYRRAWLVDQDADTLRLVYEREFGKKSDGLKLADVIEWLAGLTDN